MKKIFLFVFIFFFLVELTNASILGVSPGNINFEDVLRGGYAERIVYVSLGSEEEVRVLLEPRGEVADWLNFSEEEFWVSKDSPKNLLVSVLPPEDIPNGNYTGHIRFSVDPLSSDIEEGRAVGVIRTVIDVTINVEVTDIQYLDCRARNFQISTIEQGEDIVLSVDVLNRGNVRLRPRVEAEIWDQDMLTLIDTFSERGEEIFPTREETLIFKISSQNLEIMQYWTEISVIDCLDSEFLTFDVLEPGALRSEGRLKKIYSTLWTKVEETIPIHAEFENIGEKNVLARFTGEITLGGRVIQILESEEIFVNSGEAENFTFFFTPENPGRHIISGRVFYDRKRTFESSTVVNVEGSRFRENILMIFIYSASILIILFLLYKIKIEKKKHVQKFESLIRKNEN